jgi:hypothetical protein
MQARSYSSSIKQNKSPYAIYASMQKWYICNKINTKERKDSQTTLPTNHPSCGLSPALASLNLATFSWRIHHRLHATPTTLLTSVK